MKNIKCTLLIVMLTFFSSLVFSQNWPFLYGPNGNCSGAPTGTTILDDLIFTKLAWVSEEHDMGYGKYTTSHFNEGSLSNIPKPGGIASPIIYNNIVYMAFTKPSGKVYDQEYYNLAIAAGKTPTTQYYLIKATDYMVAIDATTGKTLWKVQHDSAGINLPQEKRGGWAVTPAAFGGKVYHLTTMGEVYAYNAKTGIQVWKSTNGSGRTLMQSKLSTALATKSLADNGNKTGFGLMMADGVLIVGDYYDGICGLDTLDGTVKWQQSNVREGCTTPAIIPVGGKQYVLVANRVGDQQHGKLTLINPINGSILWQVTSIGGNNLEDIPYTMLNIDDIVLITVENITKQATDPNCGQLAGIKITDSAPQLLWKLSDKYLHSYSWDNGPRSWYAAYNGNFYCFTNASNDYILIVDALSGTVKKEVQNNGGASQLPMIVEDHLIVNSDLAHAPTVPNGIAHFSTDPLNFIKLGGWQYTHKNTGGYDQLLVPSYANGKLFIRTGVNYSSDGIGGDLRCYDITFYPQKFSSFIVSPESISLGANATHAYTYTAKDQNGIPMKVNPKIIWSVSPGGGSIDTNGVLTTGTVGGTYYIYAKATKDTSIFDTVSFIIKKSQSIVPPTIPIQYTINPPLKLDAYATSGLPVLYTLISGPATLKGDSVFFKTAPGTIWISATQAGNIEYFAASGIMITITVQIFVSEKSITKNSPIYIGPNPATDHIIIKLNENANVRILNCYGNSMNELTIDANNPTLVDISSYPKGFYFIQIKNSRNFNSIKLIKN